MKRLTNLFPPTPWSEDQLAHFLNCVSGALAPVFGVVALAAVAFLKP